MDTPTVLKIIEMINEKILWLDSEDDKPEGFSFAGPEEPYFGKQYLAQLKDRLLREIIEVKLDEEAMYRAEEQHRLDLQREAEAYMDAENEQELNNLENQTEQ